MIGAGLNVARLSFSHDKFEERPLLPMVNPENFAIWVTVAVVLAELLKNVVFEPIVVGSVVKLHPLGL